MAAVADNSNNNGGVMVSSEEESKSNFRREVQNLVDMLSNLNPMAKEFVPTSYNHNTAASAMYTHMQDSNNLNLSFNPNYYTASTGGGSDGFPSNRRRRNTNNPNQGRRRLNGRAYRAQREDSVRRTVYVSDIDQHVTEEQLAALFSGCGQVVDCRVCGDPHSVLHFAFVEFSDEHGARAALSLGGTMLGFYPVKVLPSKTAILPVNPTFLPRSEDEREMCARTVYCTNIDKKITQVDVKLFFESTCGEVSRLRLLGDQVHSTRIAFVEFVIAESAIQALTCSGKVLGSQPIRISPSKTPVRPQVTRPTMQQQQQQ